MKVVAVLVGACAVVAAAAWAKGRLPEKGKKGMEELVKQPVYALDVERPVAFLKKHLAGALIKPEGRLFGDDAIDVTATVTVRRAATSVDIEVELLAGAQIDADEYYIRLCGTPATLDDTYALALRLCDLAKIPNDRIVAWYKEKGYESPLGAAELQTGREGEREHSVNVRSSLELEGDKLWRVVYTLYFSYSREASDKEQR